MMKACKHLDYTEGKYGPDILLCDLKAEGFPGVRFWLRGPIWTENGPGEKSNPSKVQFCALGRGRINGIFQCYQPGEMPCYEPETEEQP